MTYSPPLPRGGSRKRILPDRPLTRKEKGDRYKARYPERTKAMFAKSSRKSMLKRKYGLTEEQYDAMLVSQNGACAICGGDDPCSRMLRKGVLFERKMAVDHDHRTGAVRGLLCVRCNIMIGNSSDDPGLLIAGAEYLKRHVVSP